MFATAAAGGESEARKLNNAVRVSLRINPVQLNAGDTFTIRAAIENASEHGFFVDSRRKAHAYAHLFLADDRGNGIRGFPTVRMTLAPSSADDFVWLPPSEKITQDLDGRVNTGSVTDATEPDLGEWQGLFLDFEDSAIPLPRRGRYELTFEFATSEEWSREAERRFSLKTVWHGAVRSAPVSLVVK